MLRTTEAADRLVASGGISRRRLIGLFASAISAPAALHALEAAATSELGDRIANEAKRLKGKEYSYNGDGPSSFSCSGFTHYVVKQATNGEKLIGADLKGQWKSSRVGPKISKKQISKGDLIFFKNTQGRRKGATHVAVSLGGGKIIHSMNPKDDVKISKLKTFKRYYLGARRVTPPS